jgi:hypothetical protein
MNRPYEKVKFAKARRIVFLRKHQTFLSRRETTPIQWKEAVRKVALPLLPGPGHNVGIPEISNSGKPMAEPGASLPEIKTPSPSERGSPGILP